MRQLRISVNYCSQFFDIHGPMDIPLESCGLGCPRLLEALIGSLLFHLLGLISDELATAKMPKTERFRADLKPISKHCHDESAKKGKQRRTALCWCDCKQRIFVIRSIHYYEYMLNKHHNHIIYCAYSKWTHPAESFPLIALEHASVSSGR